MILSLQQGLKQVGVEVNLAKECRWLGVASLTVYYRDTKGQPKLREQFVRLIEAMIEEYPSFGYQHGGTHAGLQLAQVRLSA